MLYDAAGNLKSPSAMVATVPRQQVGKLDQMSKQIIAPLSGEEFFVTEALLRDYAEGAESFFGEIAALIVSSYNMCTPTRRNPRNRLACTGNTTPVCRYRRSGQPRNPYKRHQEENAGSRHSAPTSTTPLPRGIYIVSLRKGC
jgi:hypothetical protein